MKYRRRGTGRCEEYMLTRFSLSTWTPCPGKSMNLGTRCGRLFKCFHSQVFIAQGYQDSDLCGAPHSYGGVTTLKTYNCSLAPRYPFKNSKVPASFLHSCTRLSWTKSVLSKTKTRGQAAMSFSTTYIHVTSRLNHTRTAYIAGGR